MAKQDVIDNIHIYVSRLQEEGIEVSFVVLFGSHARGNPHKWSDIDLLIVSPQFDGGKRSEEVDLLWCVAAVVDSRIEPVACGLQQWDNDDESVIIEVARREGKVVSSDAKTYVGKH